MMNQIDKSPAYRKPNFTCPYCEVYSSQGWGNPLRGLTLGSNSKKPANETDKMENLFAAECSVCRKISVWMNEQMIYPIQSLAPKPVINMPDDVKEIYEEARLVSIHSPRGAAVLLRVAIEKLTPHLGETTGKLNTRIGNLQKKNTFDARVIKCLDIVRITANEGGAHDGLMDLTGAEGAKTISDLFFAINYIIEKTITEPKKLDQMFGNLPEVKRKSAEDRDKPKDKK